MGKFWYKAVGVITNLMQLLVQVLYFARNPPQVVRAAPVRSLLRKLCDAGNCGFELGKFGFKQTSFLQQFSSVELEPLQRLEVGCGRGGV